MVFSSVIFLFYFLPIAFLIYYIVPRWFKNIICLLSSLIFYAWGEPGYIWLMLLSIIANYCFGRGMGFERSQRMRKFCLVSACVFNIGTLAIFKYLTFILDTINLFSPIYIPVPDIALPLGISFYTFQSLSYLIDVYRKEVPVQKNLLDLALYISMFPQLVAGPIVRYDGIFQEIRHRSLTMYETADGIFRFVTGLSKKVLLANQMGILADTIWTTPRMSVVSAWIGMLSYSLQIYFDFSGYSDMAIGLGKMLGFHFPENFNYPYQSSSVSEFWRRWHITLGNWFRDYVYFPLGGSRTTQAKMLRNLMIVWFLTGLWHGANFTFIVWGLYYGLLLTMEKLFIKPDKWQRGKLFYRIFTLLLVMFGWVIFRSENLGQAISYLLCLFGIGASGLIDSNALLYAHDNVALLLVGAIGCTALIKTLCQRIFSACPCWLADVCRSLTVIALLGLCMLFLVNSTYNPFIYFRF